MQTDLTLQKRDFRKRVQRPKTIVSKKNRWQRQRKGRYNDQFPWFIGLLFICKSYYHSHLCCLNCLTSWCSTGLWLPVAELIGKINMAVMLNFSDSVKYIFLIWQVYIFDFVKCISLIMCNCTYNFYAAKTFYFLGLNLSERSTWRWCWISLILSNIFSWFDKFISLVLSNVFIWWFLCSKDLWLPVAELIGKISIAVMLNFSDYVKYIFLIWQMYFFGLVKCIFWSGIYNSMKQRPLTSFSWTFWKDRYGGDAEVIRKATNMSPNINFQGQLFVQQIF